MTNIWKLSIEDPEYPELLKQVTDPPKVIYGRGEKNFPKTSLAVVGSRKPTKYGLSVTKQFTAEWAAAGISIVSGLALGIDAAAHESALGAKGHTIAVLAGGVDDPSPYSNRALANRILDSGGAIISEYPQGTPPIAPYFLKRNRIIAALSLGVAIIEGTKISGSLTTASLASRYHREVFAVPGEVFSVQSEGPNSLIEIGARPLTSASVVLESFGLDGLQKKLELLSGEEDTIVRALDAPIHVSELTTLLGLRPEVVGRILTELELRGVVRGYGDGVYSRAA